MGEILQLCLQACQRRGILFDDVQIGRSITFSAAPSRPGLTLLTIVPTGTDNADLIENWCESRRSVLSATPDIRALFRIDGDRVEICRSVVLVALSRIYTQQLLSVCSKLGALRILIGVSEIESSLVLRSRCTLLRSSPRLLGRLLPRGEVCDVDAEYVPADT